MPKELIIPDDIIIPEGYVVTDLDLLVLDFLTAAIIPGEN